ncbi:F-box domain containing protein, partial [Tanacetum coccineum]
MDSRWDINRTNVEVDRLSSLPDDLVHKILSLNGLKCAIGTSVLSSRWRYIWTSMPFLDFSTEDFSTLPKFSESVNHVLSRRNNQVQVYSIKLSFRGDVTQDSVKQILNYAFSHNIQHLEVIFLLEDDVEFPFSLFSSHSLKHLSLKREFLFDKGFRLRALSYKLTVTSILDLPALTTLYLNRVTLSCDDKTYKSIGPFSKCANLKHLTLESCRTVGYNGFSVSHPLLSNLTLEEVDVSLSVNAVEVIAPQLKSLTIKHWSSRISYFVTAPHLESLVYDGHHPLFIFSNGFGSLEKVDLRVSCRDLKDAPKMFSLLQHLHSVKFLRLNLE